MKIGFDAKRFFFNHRGLGNYSRTLISNLAKFYPQNHYYLFTPHIKENNYKKIAEQHPSIITKEYPYIAHQIWRSFLLPTQLKVNNIELFHGLSHELPFGINKLKLKKIVTIHDLIFLRNPELFPWLDRSIYNLKFRYACKHADKIIAVSEQTKKDLIDFFKIRDSKIITLYQSCDKSFWNQVDHIEKVKVKTKYKLPNKFFLYVGAMEERKNVLRLVEAYSKVANKIEQNLVLIGGQTAYLDKVLDSISLRKMEDRIIHLKDVAKEDMPAIYQMSNLFLYPALFEGFGIPVLEALVSGTPVITSKGSSLEEVGGPGSYYVDPESIDQIRDAIEKLANNDVQKNRMSEEGLTWAQKFSAPNLTSQLHQIYQEF